MLSKQEGNDSGMEDGPKKEREYIREKQTSIEEATNLDDSLDKSKFQDSMATRRNQRGLGGAGWKSTGDLISSRVGKFGAAGNISLDDSPLRIPVNASFRTDDRWMAAASIRNRASQYSEQVRRREKERRELLTSLRANRTMPPIGPSLNNLPSFNSNRYTYSFKNTGQNSSYLSNRSFPTFSLTGRYDFV